MLFYGNATVGGPSVSPQQAVQLLSQGLDKLPPATREALQRARAQVASPTFQSALASSVLPRSERGVKMISVMVGLGWPITDSRVRAAYADILGGTVGNNLRFDGKSIAGLRTTGARLSYGNQTMTAVTGW